MSKFSDWLSNLGKNVNNAEETTNNVLGYLQNAANGIFGGVSEGINGLKNVDPEQYKEQQQTKMIILAIVVIAFLYITKKH
jgi:hypothetical protein